MRTTRQNGFVLVVVLCMVIMLAVLLFSFNHKVRADLYAADDLRGSTEALNCAGAGLSIAVAAIRDTPDIRADEELMRLFSGERSVSVGRGECTITVVAESGKINVNRLKNKNSRLDGAGVDRLLRLIDLLNRKSFDDSPISYAVVPAVIDWIDSDDQVASLPFVRGGALGAESGYYSGLPVPYNCRNGSIDTLAELLRVRGVTKPLLDRLRPHLTVHGDGRIDINSASALVIETLSEKMDPLLARMIVERRRRRPFESVAELREVPGMTDNIYSDMAPSLTTAPEDGYYSVTAIGVFEEHRRTVSAILRRNTGAKSVDVVLYEEH